MGFGEQIALIGILWAIFYADPTATQNILIGLGMTLPYFPFVNSVTIIVFLLGFYFNLIVTLKDNLQKHKGGLRH